MNDELLIEYLEGIINEILATVGNTDFTQPGADLAAISQIQYYLDQFGLQVQQVLPFQTILQYFGGVDQATQLLESVGDENVAPVMAVTPQGLIAEPFQKPIHLKAVEQLVDSSMGDMSAAIATAKVSAGVSITAALADVQQKITTGMIKGDTIRATRQAVMDDFLKRGMDCIITADGRTLPLKFYAGTVVRTKSREATVQGSANRWKDAGHDLLIIVGNGDQCEICARYNGLVVSQSGNTPGFPKLGAEHIKLPPFHPNCMCGTRAFIEKFEGEEAVQQAKERAAAFDPFEDRRTPEQKEQYEEMQKLRVIANREAKQYLRWQNVLGAEAPKTIGAFRTMKRKNSPKFQELQSAFLSATHMKMASPEAIKAAEDKAKAKAAAMKKAQADAAFAAKEKAEAEKLAKKQAALKKAKEELAAKKAKEAKEAKEKAALEAAAAKQKKELQAQQDALDAAAKKAAEASKAATLTAKDSVIAHRIAEEAAKRKRLAAGLPPPNDGPRKVATDTEELVKMLKQGNELETDVMEYIKKKHADMPDLPARMDELYKVRDRWMVTSVRGSSAVVQDWYNERLGTGYNTLASDLHRSEFQVHPDLPLLMESQGEYVREQLRGAGYTHIKIYRGVKVYEDDLPGWYPKNYDANGRTAINDNEHGKALNSWSFDPSIAKGFARGADKGAIQAAEIPVEQIWGLFGFGSEREIVPMGLVEDVETLAMSDQLKDMLGSPAWAKDLEKPFDIQYPHIEDPDD